MIMHNKSTCTVNGIDWSNVATVINISIAVVAADINRDSDVT
jgi:hypothetical protein